GLGVVAGRPEPDRVPLVDPQRGHLQQAPGADLAIPAAGQVGHLHDRLVLRRQADEVRRRAQVEAVLVLDSQVLGCLSQACSAPSPSPPQRPPRRGPNRGSLRLRPPLYPRRRARPPSGPAPAPRREAAPGPSPRSALRCPGPSGPAPRPPRRSPPATRSPRRSR